MRQVGKRLAVMLLTMAMVLTMPLLANVSDRSINNGKAHEGGLTEVYANTDPAFTKAPGNIVVQKGEAAQVTFRFYRTPTDANDGYLYEMSGPGGSVLQTLDAVNPADLSSDKDCTLTVPAPTLSAGVPSVKKYYQILIDDGGSNYKTCDFTIEWRTPINEISVPGFQRAYLGAFAGNLGYQTVPAGSNYYCALEWHLSNDNGNSWKPTVAGDVFEQGLLYKPIFRIYPKTGYMFAVAPGTDVGGNHRGISYAGTWSIPNIPTTLTPELFGFSYLEDLFKNEKGLFYLEGPAMSAIGKPPTSLHIEGKDYNAQDLTSDITGAGWKWNAATNQLELNGYDTSGMEDGSIYAERAGDNAWTFEIYIKGGTNVVRVGSKTKRIGIFSNGNIHITGESSGTLQINNEASGVHGIRSQEGNVCLEAASRVEVKSKYISLQGYDGVHLKGTGDITIEGKVFNDGADPIEIGGQGHLSIKSSYGPAIEGYGNVVIGGLRSVDLTSSFEEAILMKMAGSSLIIEGYGKPLKFTNGNGSAAAIRNSVDGNNPVGGTTIGNYNVSGDPSKAKVVYSKPTVTSLTLSPASVAYDGQEKAPAVTVKNENGEAIAEEDYTIVYKNSAGKVVTSMTEIGKYTIVAMGQGRYSGSAQGTFEIIKSGPPCKIKALWVSKHENTFVTFNWSGTPNNNLATGWDVQYRTKLIGTQYAWSKWIGSRESGKTLSKRVYLKPNYTIEFKVRHEGETAYCRSVFTTPAGGKYQSITQCRVKVVATASGAAYRQGTKTLALKTGINFSGDTGNTIYIKKGTSIKITPNHVYPRSNFTKYPRLYPNHAWYDVTDSTVASLTGTASTAGMKDGAVTIKGLKAGTTIIKITSCNGRGSTLTVVVK